MSVGIITGAVVTSTRAHESRKNENPGGSPNG
jgi:hypothetical protein